MCASTSTPSRTTRRATRASWMTGAHLWLVLSKMLTWWRRVVPRRMLATVLPRLTRTKTASSLLERRLTSETHTSRTRLPNAWSASNSRPQAWSPTTTRTGTDRPPSMSSKLATRSGSRRWQMLGITCPQPTSMLKPKPTPSTTTNGGNLAVPTTTNLATTTGTPPSTTTLMTLMTISTTTTIRNIPTRSTLTSTMTRLETCRMSTTTTSPRARAPKPRGRARARPQSITAITVITTTTRRT
mmetsp:Transcript_34034/g.77732  ORF Transcript_34034/g.77732 Transcript_34034/m.77732 type:complete len:242 (+) Transcript_34034:433-1158(+)